MSKIGEFLKDPEFDKYAMYEKINGNYGCKYCDENMTYAFWDEHGGMLFWICSKKHRTEQQVV